VTTYLYGLILSRSAATAPSDARGIDDEAVRVLAGPRIAALVGTMDEPVAATLENVKRHDAVLQRFVDAGVTTVAARFRQIFGDEADLQRHVDEYGDRVARILEEFDGCVEMRLLMRDTGALPGTEAPAVTAAGPGHAYLEQLRSRHMRATHLALAPMLGAVIRAESVSQLPDDRGVVFAHLVERGRVDQYRESVRAYPALAEAAVVGPLAFYSFAEP
jgi:hypothetical protein